MVMFLIQGAERLNILELECALLMYISYVLPDPSSKYPVMAIQSSFKASLAVYPKQKGPPCYISASTAFFRYSDQ